MREGEGSGRKRERGGERERGGKGVSGEEKRKRGGKSVSGAKGTSAGARRRLMVRCQDTACGGWGLRDGPDAWTMKYA